MTQVRLLFQGKWRLLVIMASLLVALTVSLWLISQAGVDAAPSAVQTYSSTSLSAEGASATSKLFLPAAAKRHSPKKSDFGLYMGSVTKARGLDQAVDAGVSRVRSIVFRWDQIEPERTSPPTYHWDVVNETSLINAAENEIDVLAIVHGTPKWAQKVAGHTCGPVASDHLDEFAEFMNALVARYSQPPFNLRYFELGNEPDIDPSLVAPDSLLGCWGDSSDPYYGGGYYADMLKAAYPAIKQAEPYAVVFLGGLLMDCDPSNPPAGRDCTPSKFLEGILRNGGGPYFDVVSFHAYSYYSPGAPGKITNPGWPGSKTALPEKVNYIRSVLSQYGFDHKPLVNTEAALVCDAGKDECLAPQAWYVVRSFAEARALRLKGMYYHQLIREGWGDTGLIMPDLTKTSLHKVFRIANAFLGNSVNMDPLEGYPYGIAGFSFRRLGYHVEFDVIWSADGSLIPVGLPDEVSAYDVNGDLLGTSALGYDDEQSVTIEVGSSPVYIIYRSISGFDWSP